MHRVVRVLVRSVEVAEGECDIFFEAGWDVRLRRLLVRDAEEEDKMTAEE
jgi:hypothetical protein